MTPTLCACASSEQGRGHLPHWDSVGRGRHRALRSRGRAAPTQSAQPAGGAPPDALFAASLNTPLQPCMSRGAGPAPAAAGCPGLHCHQAHGWAQRLTRSKLARTPAAAGPQGWPTVSEAATLYQLTPSANGIDEPAERPAEGPLLPVLPAPLRVQRQSSPDRQPQGQRAVSTASELPSPSSCKSTTHISAKDLGIAPVVAAPDRSLEQCRPLCPALALPSSGLEAGGAHTSPQLTIQRDASLGAGVWNRASPWALRSPASCSPRDRREAETPHATPASSRGAHAPAWAAGTGPCPRQWGDGAPEGRAQGRPQLLSSSPSPGDSTGPRRRRPEPAH